MLTRCFSRRAILGVALFATLLLRQRPVSAQPAAFEKAELACSLPWDADWITAISFVGQKRFAAGNNLGEILVWATPESAKSPAPQPLRRLVGHSNAITRMLSTPDGRWLISASNDRTIKLWDLDAEPSGKGTAFLNGRAIEEAKRTKRSKQPAPIEVKLATQEAGRTLTGHNDWVQGLSLSADGKTLASGDDKGLVILWDLPSGKEVRRWKTKGWVWGLAIAPDAKSALISERIPLVFDSGQLSALRLWDAQKGEVKVDLSKQFKERFSAAGYSKDGKYLAIARGGEVDGLNGKVVLLDPATGKKIRESASGHLNGATDLAFHPDGKHLFSSGRDTTVRIWDLGSGKQIKELGKGRGGQFKDWIHAVSISPDGHWCVAADMAGFVHVWHFPK